MYPWRPPGRTRTLLGAAAAAAAGALGAYAFGVEPFRLTITRHRVRLRTGTGEGSVLRMVQLTDLHLHGIGRLEEAVATKVAELAPDVIVITGDMIERAALLPLLTRFLSMLPAGTPLYAVMGNWDHRARVGTARMRECYAGAGGVLLINESIVHRHAGRELLLTGIDDLAKGSPDLDASFADVAPREAHIVLAHCPAQRDILRAWLGRRSSPDRFGSSGDDEAPTPRLLLAGHTHGGQVRILGRAPILPRASGRYVSGWYRDFEPEMYVSRGIGTSLAPVRFGSPPEIAMFELVI